MGRKPNKNTKKNPPKKRASKAVQEEYEESDLFGIELKKKPSKL